jgi:uncharacterized protein (TIGR02145 family)
MKKLFTLILGITLAYSCSTSSDGNGNSNTTVVPVTPSNLIGVVTSTTQINLSWTDNSTNESGFKIERKTGTGTYAVVGTTATDVTTFIDTGLTPSTTYTYRVYSYNAGGNSPTYSNELTLTTANVITLNVPGPNLTDIDGNTYQSVTNCGLTFTKTNLNVSKYTDGTTIPQVTDPTQWANLTTGAWCYYNNTTANGTTYGRLYNWYAVVGIYDAASAVNPALRKKLAPAGWHVPTDTEWSSLFNCLDPNADGGNNIPNIAGGKMKSASTLWQSPNTDATNASGFTGLPGAFRGFNGAFDSIGYYGSWWSSSEANTADAWYRELLYTKGNAYRSFGYKKNGLSVRCIKD